MCIYYPSVGRTLSKFYNPFAGTIQGVQPKGSSKNRLTLVGRMLFVLHDAHDVDIRQPLAACFKSACSSGDTMMSGNI